MVLESILVILDGFDHEKSNGRNKQTSHKYQRNEIDRQPFDKTNPNTHQKL